MTLAEREAENRLFIAHARLAGDFLVDKSLCLASFARAAAARGNRFVLSHGANS
ncbi:MAG: hypothetical protein AB7E70_19590 [Hyphomicrobiaceae bacterium]